MTITIQARRDDQNWLEAITVTGTTRAHAIRNAARRLEMGPGRALTIERVGTHQLLVNWSGKRLHVVENRSGPTKSHADRRRDSGKISVQAYLSPEAVAKLDEIAEQAGSRTAAIEAAVLAYRVAKK